MELRWLVLDSKIRNELLKVARIKAWKRSEVKFCKQNADIPRHSSLPKHFLMHKETLRNKRTHTHTNTHTKFTWPSFQHELFQFFQIQCHGHLPVVNRQLPVLVARSPGARRLGRNDALVAGVAEGAARYPGVQAGQGKGWAMPTALSGYFCRWEKLMENWKKPWKSIHPKISLMIFCRLQRRRFELSCKTIFFFESTIGPTLWRQWSHPWSDSQTVNLDTWSWDLESRHNCCFTKCLVAVAEAAPHLSGWKRVRFNTPNLYEIKFGVENPWRFYC